MAKPIITCLLVLDAPYPDLAETIRIFRGQDYEFKELLVINNTGSLLDASEHRRHASDLVRFLDLEESVPLGIALNMAKQVANGTYMTRMRTYQWWAFDRLSKQWDAIEYTKAKSSTLSASLVYSRQTGHCGVVSNSKECIPSALLLPLEYDFGPYSYGLELDLLERLSNGAHGVTVLRAPELLCDVRPAKEGDAEDVPYGDAVQSYEAAFKTVYESQLGRRRHLLPSS